MAWKLWLRVAIGWVAISVTGGCVAAPTPAHLKIAMLVRASDTPFWHAIHAGAQQAAVEDRRVDVLWLTPARPNDALAQRKQLEEILTLGINGLILAPADPQGMGPAIELALQRGIPCLTMEQPVELGPEVLANPLFLGTVGTDHSEAGTRAAQRFVESVGDAMRFKVLVLREPGPAAGIDQNLTAFRAAIKRAKAIEVIEVPAPAAGEAEPLDRAAAGLFKAHPDAAGAYGLSVAATRALLKARPHATETEGENPKPVVVGFDSDAALGETLVNGEVQGLVLQDPFDMGYQATKRMLAHLKGDPRPADLMKFTQAQLATPENLDDPIVKVLLTPRQGGN